MRAKLDQHFLIDEGAAERIVEAAAIKEGEELVEIGPGEGVLTRKLLRAGARLTAIEIDEGLHEDLAARFRGNANLRSIRADFLQMDLAGLPSPAKIVANLPYSVATPILQRVLSWSGWTRAVLMFQKEVARRICAGPGEPEYGLLSVSVAAHAEAVELFVLPRHAFRPPPKVESAVLMLQRLERSRLPEGLSEELFFRIVRAAFSQRRKMAVNSLAAALRLDREPVAAAMRQAGLEPTDRAERIPVDGFLRLAESIRALLTIA